MDVVPKLERLPLAMRESMSRLKVVINFGPWQAECTRCADHLRSFAAIIRTVPCWQDLTVQLIREEEGRLKANEAQWRTAEKMIVLPLQYLRKLKNVKFEGMLDAALGERLADQMTSSTSIPDLEAMFEAIEDYVNYFFKGDPYGFVDRSLEDEDNDFSGTKSLAITLLMMLAKSRDDCNVEEFNRDRDRLMRLMTSLILK